MHKERNKGIKNDELSYELINLLFNSLTVVILCSDFLNYTMIKKNELNEKLSES